MAPHRHCQLIMYVCLVHIFVLLFTHLFCMRNSFYRIKIQAVTGCMTAQHRAWSRESIKKPSPTLISLSHGRHQELECLCSLSTREKESWWSLRCSTPVKRVWLDHGYPISKTANVRRLQLPLCGAHAALVKRVQSLQLLSTLPKKHIVPPVAPTRAGTPSSMVAAKAPI